MAATADDKRWFVEPDAEIIARARKLSAAMELHPILAQVLVRRGVTDENTIRRFLEPRLRDLMPPKEMADFHRAIEIVAQAVKDRRKVAVFGDYDVDGITSSALLGDFLRRCGAEVSVRVAKRDEGYGFGVPQAEEMVRRGCSLLLLADCGTSDHAAVEVATKSGVDVLAVDHHQVTRGEWPGLALLNPQRPDCAYPYKGLTSVGLAFYLVAMLRRHLEANGRSVPDPKESLDLVALGTVADVAPLNGENRILVAHGLVKLAETKRPGLRELLRLCKMTDRTPTSEGIGWRLGPRLNAPGRLGDAAVSFDCLWQTDEEQGIRSARKCDALNEERKAIQDAVQRQAMELAREQMRRGRSFLLIAGERWHPGVVGIVAGRLVTAFNRPAAVVALEGQHGKASARSVPGVDLVDLLRQAGEHLVRFGGHAAAAGFSVMQDQLEHLHQRLDGLAAPQIAQLKERPLEVDGLLELSDVTRGLCRELEQLGPHGYGNPEPVFVTSGVTVAYARSVGEDHLRLELRSDNTVKTAIGFGMLDQLPNRGDALDIAFVPEIDTHRGPKLRLRLFDLRRSGEGTPLRSEER